MTLNSGTAVKTSHQDLTSHAVENIIFDLIQASDFATSQRDRSDFTFGKQAHRPSDLQLFQVVSIIFLVGFLIPFGMKRSMEEGASTSCKESWKPCQDWKPFLH